MLRELIAVGDVMLDGAVPAPVEGRRVHGRIELRPGGSAANAALEAARLGGRAAVIGRIGADPAGRLVSDALADAGVEVLLALDADAPTGCVVVIGDSAIVADPGASGMLSPEDLPATLEAHAVLVSGYSLLQSGSEPAARAALERARTTLLAIDAASANLVEAYGVDQFFAATAQADVLLVNADEARVLTGLADDAAALALAARYRVACVKLGGGGAVAASAGATVRATVQSVEHADTLGAGDAFAAGFLLALGRGAELAAGVTAGCETATKLVRGRSAARRAVAPRS